MGSSMSQTESSPCGCCCPCYDTSPKEKYPHIKYRTPETAQYVTESHVDKLPLDNVLFEFSQPQCDFSVHPQMTGGHEPEVPAVVSNQPHYYRPHSIEQSGTSRESAPADLAVLSTLPTIHYSIYHDIQRNTLAIHLQQAFNLPDRHKNKPLDSYVVLYLLPHKHEVFESKVVKRSLNPIYQQEFEFTGQPDAHMIRKQTLVFKILGHGRYSSGELIGMVAVKLENADLFGETTHARIQEKSVDITKVETMGDILFSLTYIPQSDSIQGIILRAINLQQQDIGGSADPYVKVKVVHKGKTVHKWKSSVKKNTMMPTFNDDFQFNIYNLDLDDMHLEFIVMDYDRFSHDDLVGIIKVGPKVPDEKGRTHWEEIMDAPNQLISRWHPIMPISHVQEHAQTL